MRVRLFKEKNPGHNGHPIPPGAKRQRTETNGRRAAHRHHNVRAHHVQRHWRGFPEERIEDHTREDGGVDDDRVQNHVRREEHRPLRMGGTSAMSENDRAARGMLRPAADRRADRLAGASEGFSQFPVHTTMLTALAILSAKIRSAGGVLVTSTRRPQ